MTATPRVTVVVLNWNGREDTLRCLGSLQGVQYPDRSVVVVDNGSRDGSVAAIRSAHPAVTLIEAGANLGFAAGNNLGIEVGLARGADFVLLLNNDTVVAPDVLAWLVAAAEEHPATAAVSPKIYLMDDPQRIWYAGGRWRTAEGKMEHVDAGILDEDTAETADVRETDYACGCAMLLRASVLREVGLLDPEFFLLFEETDWCFRARDKGYSCRVALRAHVWHKVSSSFGGRSSPLYAYFYARNWLLWSKRHLPWRDYLRVCFTTVLQAAEPASEPLQMAGQFVSGRTGFKQTYWNAATWMRAIRGPAWSASARAVRRARRRGIMDYLRRRFGDCPASVRTMNRFVQLTDRRGVGSGTDERTRSL